MNIGISMSVTERTGDFGSIANLIEDLGFESVWLPEHPIMPVKHNSIYRGTNDGSIPDFMYLGIHPLIALSLASANTTTLKLGTAVNLITEHNPIDLAKQIATLDFYSKGRFLYGIGTGWFKEEAEIMGSDFDHRWTQAKEYLLIMKELWTKDEAEFHGQYISFPAVICNPKPYHKPYPPIMIGGNARNVLDRVVKWGDGWIPVGVSPDMISKSRDKLKQLCESENRDFKELNITIHGQSSDKNLIKKYFSSGADRVLIAVQSIDHDDIVKELYRIRDLVFN